jgi:hypothetical protein
MQRCGMGHFTRPPIRAGAAMKAGPKVIEHLNTQLTNELTAINQYFRFCQRSRQIWRHELDGELSRRCLDDGKRSGDMTEMKQATAVGGDVLVVVGLGAAVPYPFPVGTDAFDIGLVVPCRLASPFRQPRQPKGPRLGRL